MVQCWIVGGGEQTAEGPLIQQVLRMGLFVLLGHDMVYGKGKGRTVSCGQLVPLIGLAMDSQIIRVDQ